MRVGLLHLGSFILDAMVFYSEGSGAELRYDGKLGLRHVCVHLVVWLAVLIYIHGLT